MKLSTLLKSKKAQIRGIDFAVSLLLFLILLSQVILIIVNAQIIVEGRNSLNRDDLDYLAKRLLQDEGTPGWGYKEGNLTGKFGLKDEQYPWITPMTYLDPGKLARLNIDARSLYDRNRGNLARDYYFPNYTAIRQSIAEEKLDFSFKTMLPLSIAIKVVDEEFERDLAFTVTYTGSTVPVAESELDLFWVYLGNGTVIHRSSHVTNASGQITVVNAVPTSVQDPFIVLVTCKLAVDHGMAWHVPGIFARDGRPIHDDGDFQSFVGSSENGSVAIITDSFLAQAFALADTKNHTVSLIYSFNGSYAHQIAIARDITKTIVDTERSIPTQGFVIAVSAAYHNDDFYFKVHALPTILNDDGQTDYPVFPAFTTTAYDLETIDINSMMTGIYLASCRNVTLLVAINAWESPL